MLPEPRCKIGKIAGIKSQIGYKRHPGQYSGKPSLIVYNTLDRQFDVDTPDRY
jgi:putative transposase